MIPLVVGLLVSSVPASLPEPPEVRLELPSGELPFDAEALANLLRLELGKRTVLERTGEAPSPSPSVAQVVRVVLSRSGPNTVKVTLVRPVPTEESWSVDLGQTPDEMKARALALAIGEFARAPQPAPTPAPAVATTPPPPSPQAPSPSPTVTPRADLGLRSFPSQGTTLLDVRGGLAFEPWQQSPWRCRFDLSLLMGQQRDVLGVAQMVIPTATLGLRIAEHAADVRLQLGPQIEVGRAFVLVTADQDARGNDVSAWVATAALGGEVGLRIHSGTVVQLGVELGYALRGIELRADDRRLGGMGGPMFGVTLGAEFARDGAR